MSDLKPCPFCGEPASVFKQPGSQYMVQCWSGRCSVKGPDHDTEPKAIEAWNTRATPTCGTCNFWEQHVPPDHRWGACPMIRGTVQSVSGGIPSTPADFGCILHEPRED